MDNIRQVNLCTFLLIVDLCSTVFNPMVFTSTKSLGGFMGNFPCKLLSPCAIKFLHFNSNFFGTKKLEYGLCPLMTKLLFLLCTYYCFGKLNVNSTSPKPRSFLCDP